MSDQIADEPRDHTHDLAGKLGLEPLAFAELFGSHWIKLDGPVSHDYDMDPSGGGGWPVTSWHVSGDPAMLLIRVFEHGVLLAAPRSTWTLGTDGLAYEPDLHTQTYVPFQEFDTKAPDIVRSLLLRRKRAIRYCRFCRLPTPPEFRFSEDTCMGCATLWFGVIY